MSALESSTYTFYLFLHVFAHFFADGAQSLVPVFRFLGRRLERSAQSVECCAFVSYSGEQLAEALIVAFESFNGFVCFCGHGYSLDCHERMFMFKHI